MTNPWLGTPLKTLADMGQKIMGWGLDIRKKYFDAKKARLDCETSAVINKDTLRKQAVEDECDRIRTVVRKSRVLGASGRLGLARPDWETKLKDKALLDEVFRALGARMTHIGDLEVWFVDINPPLPESQRRIG